MFTGEHGAEKIDIEDTLEGVSRDSFERGIAAFDADSDIVV